MQSFGQKIRKEDNIYRLGVQTGNNMETDVVITECEIWTRFIELKVHWRAVVYVVMNLGFR